MSTVSGFTALRLKVALSAPLPRWEIDSAEFARGLLAALKADNDVDAFVENPFRTAPDLIDAARLHPFSDLPSMRSAGTAGVPLYLIGDDPLHLHQLRSIRRCPGVVVLPSIKLDRLAECLWTTIDGRPIATVDGFRHGGNLAAELARSAMCVAVASDADAEALRGANRAAKIHVIPELSPDSPDFASAAAQLSAIVRQLPPFSPVVTGDTGTLPAVTAIVVSYNSRSIIGPCLQTLVDQDYSNLDIIVVDNASVDGTAGFIRANFPSVKVIANTRNVGFAEGNNVAFRVTRSKYVALLNQDAYARRNWVSELVCHAEADERVASVGSKILFHRCPTLLNSTGIEINEAGWCWDRRVGEKDDDPSPIPESVFGNCGAAVLYRKSALDRVGAFDRKYFMYHEDVDLAWRLRMAGFINLYAPLAVVRHDFHGDGGTTPARLLRRRFMCEHNRWATLVKNLDWRTLWRVLPQIRAYDKRRLAWLDLAVIEGNDPALHGEIARIIRRAWRFNLLRIPQLLVRRWRAQRTLAVSSAEARRFIVPGIDTGKSYGDIESYHDLFSASRRSSIVMGTSDVGSIGTGWHGVENPPIARQAYRWCMGKALFYLQPPQRTQAVLLQLQSPMRPNRLALFVERQKLGECTIEAGIGNYYFRLPSSFERQRLLEFTIETQTQQSRAIGLSDDMRDLGLMVSAIRCVESVPVGMRDDDHHLLPGLDRNLVPHRSIVRMGETDEGVIGSGFFPAERLPSTAQHYRWCNARSQLYVMVAGSPMMLVARLASPLRPHKVIVFADDARLGTVTVDAGTREFRFLLPSAPSRHPVMEITLQSETVRPTDLGISSDDRELGIMVFEMRTEPALTRSAIAMGQSDIGSIGAGWHAVERLPRSDRRYRWCMDRAFFHLQAPRGARALVLHVSSPMHNHRFTLLAEQQRLGECMVDAEGGEYCFRLPDTIDRESMIEFMIETETLQCRSTGLSEDTRDLGIIVFSMKLTEWVPRWLGPDEHFLGRYLDRSKVPRRGSIRMGVNDESMLSTGFYDVESQPGFANTYRWCSAHARFFLQPPVGARTLIGKLASPLRPHTLEVFADRDSLGEVTVGLGAEEFRFPLPDRLPRAEIVEFTLQAQTIRPKDCGVSLDERELGVIVFELLAE